MEDYERINNLKKASRSVVSNVKPTISDLTLKDENGKTYFEYLVENNIKIYDTVIIEYLTSNYDYLSYMIEHEYFLREYYDLDLLFDTSRGTPLVVKLFEKNYFEILKLPEKAINYLFEKHNDKYLIKDMLDIKDFNCSSIIKKVNNYDLLLNCLKDINRLDCLRYANEECLLHDTPTHITLYEAFIQNDVYVSTNNNNPKCAEILYKYNKYDDLLKFDTRILVNYPSKENNYLNLLIEKVKNGETINFNKKFFLHDKESYAKLYITLLKNNIEVKLPDLEDLFSGNRGQKPVIVYMLEMDKELTKKYIVNDQIVETFRKYLLNLYDEDENSSMYDDKDLDSLLLFLPNNERLKEKLDKRDRKYIKIDESDIYEDDFLKPFGGESTFIEYAIKNGIRLYNSHDLTVEEILINMVHNKGISSSITESMLYEKVSDTETLLDFLIQKKYNNLIRNSLDKDLRIIDYCKKYNNFECLSDSILDELFASINGSFYAEEFVNNESFIKSLRGYKFSQKTALLLAQKEYFQLLTHANEDTLLLNYRGKTLLEHMLDHNVDPSFYGKDFKKSSTIFILDNYKRPDLMWHAELRLLIYFPYLENNFLQYMIDSYKNGIDVGFDKKKFLVGEKEDIARCYIQMAKNGLVDLIDDFSTEFLLAEDKNKKSLLSYMMSFDRETTLNSILGRNLIKDPNVNAALKILSRDGLTDIPFAKYNCDEICRNMFNRDYAEGKTSPVENLLEELKDVFLFDKKSDKDLIEGLVIAYRYATIKDPIYIEELKTLIEIKRKNPEFHYEKGDAAFFDETQDRIVCEESTISTLLHETGHAIHYYQTKEAIPDGFFELIEQIRSDPTWIRKVENYSKKYHEIRDNVRVRANDIVKKIFLAKLTDAEDEEFENLIRTEKQRIKEIYIKKGYKEEDLDVILSETFTRNEVLKQKAAIEIGEVQDFLLRHLYDAFIAVGDFIDAISNGNYRSSVLYNENGEVIPPGYGHGVRYYNTKKYKFCEMVANYCEIIKSKHSDEVLVLLRRIVGDELVDMLDDFYKHQLLKIPVYTDENNNEVGKVR